MYTFFLYIMQNHVHCIPLGRLSQLRFRIPANRTANHVAELKSNSQSRRRTEIERQWRVTQRSGIK